MDSPQLLNASAPPLAAHPGWRLTLPALLLAVAAILVIYWQTAWSMLEIWSRSETFAHGYLIAPISAVLIWRKRHVVARMAPTPDVLGFVLLAGAGFAWLVAYAGQVQVVQQYAMTAMIPAAVLALAGRRVAWALAFPLGFLLLGVPVGEALLPRLMDFTADFTVAGLRLTGIPVYREGNFFAVPSGQWSVVEACSGLRYLIASVAVGLVYAYLTYRRLWKRLLFIALSIVVPIVANGIRAYMIVMIGHLSGMKLAVGVDHLIYGWLFFGLVIVLLFWAGSFWRDAPEDVAPRPKPSDDRAPRHRALGAGAAAALAIAAAFPLYAAFLDSADAQAATPSLTSPVGVGGWTRDATPTVAWRPDYQGAAATVFEVYRKGEQVVALYLAHYRNQRQGAELVNSQNSIAGHAVGAKWINAGEVRRTEDFGDGPRDLRQTRVVGANERWLAWDWFRISGEHTSNPYLAKALLARDKLLGRGDEGQAIVLAAPYSERVDEAQATLRQFARDMRPGIEAALRNGAGR